MSKPSRGLKFCPVSNDLLYPRENKDLRRLEYYCKNCEYVQVRLGSNLAMLVQH
jgi:DNA-directed RNA polymerase II subunit RPB9